jgi:1,4-dihydroxy-6-naphthoate synthase
MARIKVAFSGDPDDAFAWWGILEGIVRDPAIEFDASADCIASINAACMRESYDVAAVSAAAYPFLAPKYDILDAGASVARGCGPALVAAEGTDAADAFARPFAIAGRSTTGGFVFMLMHRDTRPVELPWRSIPAAIRRGDVGGGVCIHETLMDGDCNGLRTIGCLGKEWHDATGLPLPVGLVVGRRDLGAPMLARIAGLLRESVRAARRRRGEAMAFARRYSIGLDHSRLERYVDRFTNDDTETLHGDAREALAEMYARGARLRMMPRLDSIRIAGRDLVEEALHAC